MPKEYKEIHHILPRCLGGMDTSENLISLFPEEHLVAHLLLTKIYPEHEGLLYGAFKMSNYRKLTNKKYGWLKKKFVDEMRNKRLGTTLTEEIKKKISKATSGKNNAMFGKKHTDEVKKNQSELVKGKVPVVDMDGKRFLISKDDPRWISGEVTSLTKGRKHSPEDREKMSKMKKGVKKNIKKVSCPHCGIEGGGGNMTRYHFDKCKHKK